MNGDRTIWWWVLGVFGAGAVVAAVWWWQGRTPEPLPVTTAPLPAEPEAVAPSEPPVAKHPIETAPAALAADATAPLPPLADSDSVFRPAIGGLIGEQALAEFFAMTGIAARIVATVDNLPRSKVATTMLLPVRGPGGAFIVDVAADGLLLAAANAERYSAYLRLAESVPMDRLAAAYVRLYPLLQQAYRELGYPHGQFNDRLVEVIDHLLATPAVDEPIPLVQPKVLYQFADPALESRSAGQKLLLRMGAGNAARVKKTLVELRREVTAAPLPQ